MDQHCLAIITIDLSNCKSYQHGHVAKLLGFTITFSSFPYKRIHAHINEELWSVVDNWRWRVETETIGISLHHQHIEK